MAGTAFSLLLYKEERNLKRLFVEKRRTSPYLPVQCRSENALRCPDCHHEFCCPITLAAILTLAYGQSLRGDHRIDGRRDGRSSDGSDARQPFSGIPPRLP